MRDPVTADVPVTALQQLCGALFRLHDCWFLVDALRVKEIIRTSAVRWSGGLPPFVAGTMTYRGTDLPVLNLRVRLGLSEGGEASRILLLTMPGATLGILVDEVAELLTLPVADIRPSPSSLPHGIARFLIGVATVRGESIMLLDIDRLIYPEAERPLVEHPGGAQFAAAK